MTYLDIRRIIVQPVVDISHHTKWGVGLLHLHQFAGQSSHYVFVGIWSRDIPVPQVVTKFRTEGYIILINSSWLHIAVISWPKNTG